ncbi:MAG: hypothetical protein SWK76_14810 [Actinomycetota bacterium]|nr:hypothetical protein [Actinomycetota bacterium]
MSTGLIIFLAVVLGAAVLVLNATLILRWLRRLRREAIAGLREDVGSQRVYQVDDCNFFGVESAGYGQARGNGVMALAQRGIYFRMLIPRKHLFIPLASVREISHPRWFKGRSKARELLRVDFTGQAGERDAAAWLVPHREWWKEAILSLREGREPSPSPPRRR